MKTLIRAYLMILSILAPSALLLGMAIALMFWGCSETLKALPTNNKKITDTK